MRAELARVQRELGALQGTASALRSQLKQAGEAREEAASARERMLAAQVGSGGAAHKAVLPCSSRRCGSGICGGMHVVQAGPCMTAKCMARHPVTAGYASARARLRQLVLRRTACAQCMLPSLPCQVAELERTLRERDAQMEALSSSCQQASSAVISAAGPPSPSHGRHACGCARFRAALHFMLSTHPTHWPCLCAGIGL